MPNTLKNHYWSWSCWTSYTIVLKPFSSHIYSFVTYTPFYPFLEPQNLMANACKFLSPNHHEEMLFLHPYAVSGQFDHWGENLYVKMPSFCWKPFATIFTLYLLLSSWHKYEKYWLNILNALMRLNFKDLFFIFYFYENDF